MTREEAIHEWVLPAIKNTWNEKKCEEILKSLEQEPKTGHWKTNYGFGLYYDEKFYICSECNKQSMGRSSYCPNCGAKMEEK